MVSLTFIIPAFNDEVTIETVIHKAVDTGKRLGIPFDILVTNDASTDKTAKILSRLTGRVKQLMVITHHINAGYGTTIKELYQRAQGSWLFSIPGDYQIEPSQVTKLWSRRASADMIIGWRRVRRDHPSRLRQSYAYNALLRILFGLNMHDINSVRLMKTSIMKSITLTTSSAFVDAELVIKSKRAGFYVTEVPIAHRARSGVGASGGKLSTILPAILDMILFRFT